MTHTQPNEPGAQPRRWIFASFAFTMLLLGALACSFQTPENLNEGRGTREKPVPAREYAKTTDYDVRAMSVVRPLAPDVQPEDDPESEYLRVQYQIRCTKSESDVCQLASLGRNIQLVDASGILYPPIYNVELEKPLQGEILGDAEQTGWLAYKLPRGVEICCAVSEYGDDMRVFFGLP